MLNLLARVCTALAGLALLTLTVTFGWLVYGRYVLNATPTWVEQVALLLIVFITFVGAAVGVHEKTHLAVTFFRDGSPRWLRQTMLGLGYVVLGAFGAVMARNGLLLAQFKWNNLIPLLDIPEGWRAAPLVVSGVLVCLFSAAHLINLFRGRDN